MFLSIFDIYKIGIGPSSSHTMGPMVAAERFLDTLKSQGFTAARLQCSLHGSLAFTGKGHRSDMAVILGLAGMRPESFDLKTAAALEAKIASEKKLQPEGHPAYQFDPETDLIFDYDKTLPGHANGLEFRAYDGLGGLLLSRVYYSVGGGFVRSEFEMGQEDGPIETNVPYPFTNAQEMLNMARSSGKTIAQMKRENELSVYDNEVLSRRIAAIWDTMSGCLDAGLSTEGILPGGLFVKRRARDVYQSLQAEHGVNTAPPHIINDWISTYAMAVNEENAAGGRVVTAPTNGAAGVIPATLKYYLDHVPAASESKIEEFLLTSAAIGGIIKHNASISGAEVGCQGEVGSAAAMAAAGLCAILGGSAEQIENAAEIALEHHLGMTCDPAKGLVQVPCIERNGLGAIKAVSAASLALRGDGTHIVPLDACVKTMLETGRDMNSKYKETSLGGLAVNIPAC